MCSPKALGDIPKAAIRAANARRKSGSGMITLPTWLPAMLKVLDAALSMTRRSAISGAAFAIGTWVAPRNTRSW